MTLCLNPRPTIPSGLLSDPYFQREVLSREALIFTAIFYELYPKDFLEYGESIISVKDLLVAPADKIYEIDEEAAGGYSYMFSAISLSFEPVWKMFVDTTVSEEVAFAKAFAVDLVALFGLVALNQMEESGSLVPKAALGIVVALISGYALLDTTAHGVLSLKGIKGGIGAVISRGLFFLMFETIAIFLFMSALGYLNHVATGV